MQIKKVEEGYELNNGEEIVILKDNIKLRHIMENFDIFVKVAKKVGDKPKTFIDSLTEDDKSELIKWVKENI